MRIIAETPYETIEGEADPCQDFDGRFVVIDDTGERLMVSGWLCDISFPDFPGFTVDQVIAGLTIPACSEV